MLSSLTTLYQPTGGQMEKRQNYSEKSALVTLLALEQQLIDSTCLFEYIAVAHLKLQSLIPAKNLLVWVSLSDTEKIEYVYEQDEKDIADKPGDTAILPSAIKSPTAWVIRNNKKLIFKRHQTIAEGKWGVGSRSEFWVGLPLRNNLQNSVGALVVQSYEKRFAYTEEQINLLRTFSALIAKAVNKHRDVENIASIVVQRTKQLERELAKKALSEKIQQAVYDIASLNHRKIKLEEVFKTVHKTLNRFIDASNIVISEYRAARNEVYFSYVVDADDLEHYRGKTVTLSSSLTSYIINKRKADLLNQEILKAKRMTGEIVGVVGNAQFNSWIGAPMISGGDVYGVIFIQSYDKHIFYTPADVELLQYVATQVATILDIRSKTERSLLAKAEISKQHQELAAKNSKLQATLEDLKKTQQKLIQKEKMNALNTLVAGVAHEVNTPLGVCITCISDSLNRFEKLENAILKNQLSTKDFLSFIKKRQQLGPLLSSNMTKAIQLVDSFREVSINSSQPQLMHIQLHQLLLSIKQVFDKTAAASKYKLTIECPKHIELLTNVQALENIISYLISNSVTHAFSTKENGEMLLQASLTADTVTLIYSDSGQGMEADHVEKLFYPFFTTQRNQGSKGLGAYHLYNLVTSALQGDIQVHSPAGRGLSFQIDIPTGLSK